MRYTFINSIGQKFLFFAVFLLLISRNSLAQLPTCIGASAGLIYYINGTNIYNLDPAQPISATNPVLNTITVPLNSNGLSLGPNLSAASPSPTFYIIDPNNNYEYYNGTTWVNTGFNTGNPAAVNPGGGGSFIYNLVGNTGQVYVFNGTATGTLLATVNNGLGGGPYDIATDVSGNFYVLQCTPPAAIREYNPSGTLINTITVTGAPNVGLGGGFAIIDNNVYFDNGNFYGGKICSGTVNVSLLGTLIPGPSDFGSCPLSPLPLDNAQTIYQCPGGPAVSLGIAGDAPYTWTVLSGPAVVTGNGDIVSATTAASSVVVGQSIGSVPGSLGCAIGTTDTFKIVVPTAIVTSGLPATVTGCGSYTDTLSGHIADTIAGLTYNYAWSPALVVTSGGNTPHPIVFPVANTVFTLTVSTPANEGGCAFSDSGLLTIQDEGVKAIFTDTVHYGCVADTNYFTNQSTNLAAAPLRLLWAFGDNASDVTPNPVYVYTSQGTHSVLLTVTNGRCTDSVRQTVDPPHPIKATFTVSADTICQGTTITLTNTSAGTMPTYTWNFGDGGSDTATTPNHTYLYEGTFLVTLTEKDFVPCYDTARMYVTVDSQSFINFTTSDSVLCQGQAITFTGEYVSNGYTGNTWDFGDGTVINNSNPIVHGYELPGVYQVSLNAKYRVCRDTLTKKSISVFAYPAINLGTDTSMCPNGNPILLTDLVNAGNPTAKWLWNTGDTSSSILATQPGVYYATVSLNGCSGSDSVWVKNDCYLSIPNSFTPNNDGLNDYFFPRQRLAAGVATFKLDIFNRWGQAMFETTNIDGRGWDGKFNNADQPEGVYIYTINATFKDGETEQYKGNVTLLR